MLEPFKTWLTPSQWDTGAVEQLFLVLHNCPEMHYSSAKELISNSQNVINFHTVFNVLMLLLLLLL